MTAPSISVAIPTRKRAASLVCCVGSVLENDCPELLEILVVANPDDKAALAFCAEMMKAQPKLRIALSPLACRNAAKNLAVEKAAGDYLYFLDDDITLPQGNIRMLAKKISEHPQTVALGGPNLTPRGSGNVWEQAIGLVLIQPFATYMTRARYIAAPRAFKASENSLQSCNLCVKKSALRNFSPPFEARMFSGEETLLLYRLRKKDLEMLSSPELKAEHHRRSGFFSFCRQIFLCGAGRAQMSRLERDSFRMVFALPSLFVLYLLGLTLFPPAYSDSLLWWPLYAYAGLLGLSTLTIALNAALPPVALTLLLVPALHLSYGAGFLTGLLADKKTPAPIS